MPMELINHYISGIIIASIIFCIVRDPNKLSDRQIVEAIIIVIAWPIFFTFLISGVFRKFVVWLGR